MSKVDYKKTALKAAKELNYGQAVINEVRAAKSDQEISRIMRNARKQEVICKPRQKVSCHLDMDTFMWVC